MRSPRRSLPHGPLKFFPCADPHILWFYGFGFVFLGTFPLPLKFQVSMPSDEKFSRQTQLCQARAVPAAVAREGLILWQPDP